ncbi:hypothetical protein M3Y95_00772200 [Aphelenchoides besseyi]|nr:hypothetical protein M3Y95_00772200 [Aphelenchoides besseyi]
MLRISIVLFLTVQLIYSICNENHCDWRTENALTAVKNQRNCDACWAFAVTVVLEYFYYKTHHRKQVFSEQHLIDCGNKYKSFLGFCNPPPDKVNGGDPLTAFQVIHKLGGIYNSTAYPWNDGFFQECQNHPEEHQYLPGRAAFRAWNMKTAKNDVLKRTIRTVGPVVADIYAPDDWNGRESKAIYTTECAGRTNHAVVIIGYGEDDGIPYWLVQNSWGPRWADNGYIKIAMRTDNGDCGLKRNIAYIA